MNPADEFELSLPLRGLPLVIGVDGPGGDMDRLGFAGVVWACTPPFDVVAGDFESGGA